MPTRLPLKRQDARDHGRLGRPDQGRCDPGGFARDLEHHVAYRGTDDGIHELTRSEEGAWTYTDLTAR